MVGLAFGWGAREISYPYPTDGHAYIKEHAGVWDPPLGEKHGYVIVEFWDTSTHWWGPDDLVNRVMVIPPGLDAMELQDEYHKELDYRWAYGAALKQTGHISGGRRLLGGMAFGPAGGHRYDVYHVPEEK